MTVPAAPLGQAGLRLFLYISNTPTEIALIEDLTPPSLSNGDREVKPLNSTVKNHYPTVVDPGEVSFSFYFQPTNALHAALYARAIAPNAANLDRWQVRWSNASNTTYDGFGYISAWSPQGGDVESNAMVDVTIKCSGIWTLTM